MKSYGSAVAHVLGAYLAGLLTIALTLTNGQVSKAALVALAPAAVTLTVETLYQVFGVFDPGNLSKLASMADSVEPLIEKYLPTLAGTKNDISVTSGSKPPVFTELPPHGKPM